MNSERLQKVLSRAGHGSRRKCEEIIVSGRVIVNGHPASIGMKVNPAKDTILVDGKKIKPQERLVYIALNKPRGVISAVESQDERKTVLDLVDIPERVYPVGRLDADSEGLILLTNDGELTNRLTHPRYGHEKEYRVLVGRKPDREQLLIWRRGVVLPDGTRSMPARVHIEGKSSKGVWLRVIMQEGKKRQIRETGLQIGLPDKRILGGLRSLCTTPLIVFGPVLSSTLSVALCAYARPSNAWSMIGAASFSESRPFFFNRS